MCSRQFRGAFQSVFSAWVSIIIIILFAEAKKLAKTCRTLEQQRISECYKCTFRVCSDLFCFECNNFAWKDIYVVR